MNAPRIEQMAEEIVEVADRLKTSVAGDHPTPDVYRDIYTLRRSVETLEREMRDDSLGTQGDAC